jgi:hypothetical protein
MCLIIIKNLINNIITMNDSTSILLATTILALSGLGLYFYKTKHDDLDEGYNKEDDNEESIFSSSNLFNWGASEDKHKDKDNDEDVISDNELEESEVKTRKRTSVKTQKNRKPTGSSRRRYY